jgi:hypothetical protein
VLFCYALSGIHPKLNGSETHHQSYRLFLADKALDSRSIARALCACVRAGAANYTIAVAVSDKSDSAASIHAPA